MIKNGFIPLLNYKELPVEEMIAQSAEFFEKMNSRRTVREFSSKTVPYEIIANCIKTAGTAPSGANMQPWHFTVVADPEIKKKIRIEAEKEEKEFYEHRATDEWLEALKPLGTDEHKEFLETAPYLIVIFEKKFDFSEEGKIKKHYYTKESVGLAAGLLIAAVHNAGLVSLTHTPSPMNFLNSILGRPENEKPFLILVVGYPQENAAVPDIKRKQIEEIADFI